MFIKIVTYTLIGVLFIQLASLSFSVKVPTVTIGESLFFDTKTSNDLQYAHHSQETVLMSTPHNEYQSLIFVGDIMLARHVERLMKREGKAYPFSGLQLTQLARKAAIVGNFEASVPEAHASTPNYHLKFSVPTSSLPILREAGFTHLSLANNHSFDHGEAGYQHSIRALKNNSLIPFGGEKAVTKKSITYINTTEGRIALLGINTSNSEVDHSSISELLQEASQQSFMQIAYVHWGLEYELYHTKSQKVLATFLVKEGADIIIGHHPHVVQDIDSIDGVPVFYSLGNYIFDQYFSQAVQEGLVLSIDVSPKEVYIHLHPVSSLGKLSQPYLLSGSRQKEFLSKVASRSHYELSPSIKAGKIVIPRVFATSSKMAMIEE